MSLNRLHPKFRNLPYTTVIPDAIWYTADGLIAKYQGFETKVGNECFPYPTLYICINVGCSPFAAEIVVIDVVIYRKKGTKWFLTSEVATWEKSGSSLRLVSDFCDVSNPVFDTISLQEYQSRLTTAGSSQEVTSIDGFALDQTLFWDLDPNRNCLPCEEPTGGCPSGMVWSQDECACISVDDCLDEHIVYLELQLTASIPDLPLVLRWRDKKGRIVKELPTPIGIDIGVTIAKVELFRYLAKGNIATSVTEFIAENLIEQALKGAVQYSLVQILGPAGVVASQYVALNVSTEVIPNSDPECQDEECLPGTVWVPQETACIPIPPCPDGWVRNQQTLECEKIIPPPRVWYPGVPCDMSVYLLDNFGFERDDNDNLIYPSNWPPITTTDGLTGHFISNGVGFGDIIVGVGVEDATWYFENPQEVCTPGQDICWYQQYVWFLFYPQIPQSTIVRTPGILGDSPPGPPSEITQVAFPFTVVLINEFYTFGPCP